MAKKSAKQSFGTGWVTTDEDERNIRHERAKTEKMAVRFLGGGSVAPFGDYEVTSEEGRLKKSYRVELRSLKRTRHVQARRTGRHVCLAVRRRD